MTATVNPSSSSWSSAASVAADKRLGERALGDAQDAVDRFAQALDRQRYRHADGEAVGDRDDDRPRLRWRLLDQLDADRLIRLVLQRLGAVLEIGRLAALV